MVGRLDRNSERMQAAKLSLSPEASVVLTKPSFRRSTLGGDGQWEGGVSDPVEEGGFRSD